MATNNEIPNYTKIGTRITTVVMLILLFLLAKNCVRSVMFGTTTSDQEIQQSYDLGYATGLALPEGRAAGPTESKELEDNPMLIKSYRKGYRAGRDTARRNEKATPQ